MSIKFAVVCQTRTYSGVRRMSHHQEKLLSANHQLCHFGRQFRNPRRKLRCCGITESSLIYYIYTLALKIFMKSSLISRYSSTIVEPRLFCRQNLGPTPSKKFIETTLLYVEGEIGCKLTQCFQCY